MVIANLFVTWFTGLLGYGNWLGWLIALAKGNKAIGGLAGYQLGMICFITIGLGGRGGQMINKLGG